jgi:RNA polymerase sigma factor (sigma-70 family)
MSSVHRLDPKEPTIYLCAQAGCQACLNELLAYHEGLIHFVLRRQYVGGTAYDDLLQEGRLALWHAILRYDPAQGFAFSSFAFVAIRRQIWRAVRLTERWWVWEPRSIGPDLAEQVEAAWFWLRLQAEVAAVVAHLPEQLRQIINEYYGLAGHAPRSLKAVGQLHGFSKERARHLRNDALLLLRLPALSALLRELCECGDRPAYQRTQALSRHWLRQRHYYTIGWRQGERRRCGRREV